MRRWVILIATHLAMLAMGFAGGVYTLPILTAPGPRTRRPCGPSQPRRSTQGVWPAISKAATCFTGGRRDPGLARPYRPYRAPRPGPDYKLYLAPRFVDTKEAFLLIKDRSVRVGDVKTFNGFIVEVPAGIDVRDYNTVVIWCEAFDQFISAAEYQPSSQARERARRWIP